MSNEKTVYYALEANVPGRPEQWTRNGMRHITIESALAMMNALKKMKWEMRILKITGNEEIMYAPETQS